MSDYDDTPVPGWGTMGNSTCLDPQNPEAVWPYCPSLGAAVLFACIFAAAALMHLIQAVQYRKPFCWVIIMGSVWELAGYTVRAVATRFQQSWILGTASMFPILIAPLWLDAFLFMVFARIVQYFSPHLKILGLRTTAFGAVFVSLDVAAFVVQVAGSILQGLEGDVTGNAIHIAGIVFQQCLLLCFTGCITWYRMRGIKLDTTPSQRPVSFKPLHVVLCASLTLAKIRSLFRLIGNTQAPNAAINSMEAFLYVFDAAPIAIAIGLWIVWHPGRMLAGEGAGFTLKF